MTHAQVSQAFSFRAVRGYLISVELKAPNSQLLITHLGFTPTDRRSPLPWWDRFAHDIPSVDPSKKLAKEEEPISNFEFRQEARR